MIEHEQQVLLGRYSNATLHIDDYNPNQKASLSHSGDISIVTGKDQIKEKTLILNKEATTR